MIQNIGELLKGPDIVVFFFRREETEGYWEGSVAIVDTHNVEQWHVELVGLVGTIEEKGGGEW